MAVIRHLQHQRADLLTYVFTYKADIPGDETIETVETLPTNQDINTIISSGGAVSKYIKVSGNNRYYRLENIKPSAENLHYGEIAVSFCDGYERLYIKNNHNEIVEFRPYEEITISGGLTNEILINNPLLYKSSGNVCVWSIPYTVLTSNNILVDTAVLNLREKDTGKQIIPDVVFDNTNKVVKITISSKVDIQENKYTAIIIGSANNNLINA